MTLKDLDEYLEQAYLPIRRYYIAGKPYTPLKRALNKINEKELIEVTEKRYRRKLKKEMLLKILIKKFKDKKFTYEDACQAARPVMCRSTATKYLRELLKERPDVFEVDRTRVPFEIAVLTREA